MKGKIGQAMSLGLPVVTTRIGAEGMHLQDGIHALVADEPDEFADAVVRLYRDEVLWGALRGQALTHVEERFSERAVREVLRSLFGDPHDRTAEARGGVHAG
jgi:glycosyltransferase involved in cell wall biosynthesis